MNVHMVTHWMGRRGPKQPWSRLVRYLREYLGWSIGHKFDPDADVNYILSYSVGCRRHLYPWAIWSQGRTACRFEPRPPYGLKARLWDEGVLTADLRLTESLQQAAVLSEYGAAERVPYFPVERDLFEIGDEEAHEQPIIGVVGYCTMEGRKGPVLVKELAHYPGAQRWRIKAAGRGWPVQTKEYRYKELSRFYQSLDVHLCPTVRGESPTSPFEALACGIPVVLPCGVDLLDELPSMHGIYRYEMGNFDAMYRALRECIGYLGTHDRRALRAVTEGMTVEAFCQGHEGAFEAHFGGVNDTHVEPCADVTEAAQERQGPELLHSEIAGVVEETSGPVWPPGSLPEGIQEAAYGPDARELPVVRCNPD